MNGFCAECGNKLNEKDIFCSKCGLKVELLTTLENEDAGSETESNLKIKKNSLIIAVIVIMVILIAITVSLSLKDENKSAEDNSQTIADVDEEQQGSVKIYGLSEDANIATIYISFLRNAGFGDYSSYYIYDIDGDGCEELLVISATCEADAMLYVYKYDNGNVLQIGSTGGGHCSICGNSKENGITIHYGHQGVEWINTAVIKNNSLVVEELVDMREVQDYTEFDYCIPLEYNSIDDMTTLKNYGGIDNYTLSNNDSVVNEDKYSWQESEMIPYVRAKSNYLDASIDLLKKKGALSSFSVQSSPYINGIKDTETDGIDYYADGHNNYLGIKDGRVVAMITYASPTDTLVRDVLPTDDFFITEPYISAYESGNENVRLYWKIDNGYYIISACAIGNDWLQYRPFFVIQVSDLEQCPY